MGYIHYEAPVEEQNFSTLIEVINAMEVLEDDEEYKNPVDLMFEALESEKPTISRCSSTKNTSWRRVIYALNDILITRFSHG